MYTNEKLFKYADLPDVRNVVAKLHARVVALEKKAAPKKAAAKK